MLCGRNSVVECQLPKLNVVGSSPIARLLEFFQHPADRYPVTQQLMPASPEQQKHCAVRLEPFRFRWQISQSRL
jgi:hypothetical protein